MTTPSLLGMEWTSWRHFARSIFFHSSRMTSFRDWMLDGEWCSTCFFRIPHRCLIGFRSGDILGRWITFTLFFFRNPTVALDVCLGSLSCWKSAQRPRARSDGSIFSFSIEQYICEFMMPSMTCSSPTPAALMQPHIRTLLPPCFTVGNMHFSLYSSPLQRHTVLKPSVPKTFIVFANLVLLRYCLKCYFSKGVYSFTLSTVYICEIQAKVSKSNYEITSIKVGFQPLISL